MPDRRDRRDPTALGERYLALRKMGDSIDAAVCATAPDYVDVGIEAETQAAWRAEHPDGLPEAE